MITRLIKGLIVLMPLAMAGRAVAQERYSYNTMAPRVSMEDMNLFIADAGLEDTGEAAFLRSLHAELVRDYQTSREVLEEKRRVSFQAQQRYRSDHPDVRDPSRIGLDFGWSEAWSEYCSEIDSLERQFLDEVEGSLPGRSRELWRDRRIDLHRRDLLRDLRIGWSYMPGARSLMDLIEIVESLELSVEARAAVSGVEAAYRADMHAVLHDWRERALAIQRELRGATVFENMRGTPEGDRRNALWQELAPRWQALVLDVVAINDRFIPRFAASLDEPHRAMFEDQVDRMRFPNIFLPCPVEISMGLLRDCLSPDEGLRDAAQRIWNDYEPQRGALRRTMIAAQEGFETRQRVLDLERQAREVQRRYVQGEDVRSMALLHEHPAEPLFAQSRALAERASRQLRALFTDDQFAELPLSARLALEWWQE